MKLRITLVAALLAFSLVLPTAQAATILFDNFDGYADQAAFEAAWTPIGTAAPLSGELSTEQSVTAPNSIKVSGTAVNNQQRNQRTFAETGLPNATDKIVWSFDFYDSNGAASPYRQYSNLQDTVAPGGTNQLLSMGMNNNQTAANSGGNFYMARILGYNPTAVADPDGGPAESVGGAGAYFKLNDFGVGLRSTGWHRLKLAISSDDGLSTDFDFYVDGVLAERVHNVGTAATLRSYDNIRIGSGVSNANNAAYYDNVWVRTVPIPEPGTFVLTVVGLVAFAFRRRSA